MTPWIVVAAVAIGSWLFRVSMLVVAGRSGLPPIIDRAARYAMPVSFTALAAAALGDQMAASGSIVPVVAVVVGVIAVRRTHSPYAAILVGLPIAWLLS